MCLLGVIKLLHINKDVPFLLDKVIRYYYELMQMCLFGSLHKGKIKVFPTNSNFYKIRTSVNTKYCLLPKIEQIFRLCSYKSYKGRTGQRNEYRVNQCCGSVSFWSGAGSADPLREIMDPKFRLFFLVSYHQKHYTQKYDFFLVI